MSFSFKKSLGCFSLAGIITALVACGGSGAPEGEQLKPGEQLIVTGFSAGPNNPDNNSLFITYKSGGVGYYRFNSYDKFTSGDKAVATVNYIRHNNQATFTGGCNFWTNTFVEPGPTYVKEVAQLSWVINIAFDSEDSNEGLAEVSTAVISSTSSTIKVTDVPAVSTNCPAKLVNATNY